MIIFAYLDPGSGSALVGTLVAVAGALLYSLKSLFYRLVRWRTPEELAMLNRESFDIAIFSEGKNYWGTFKEIVAELITRKEHFAYYTMDLYDPALLIDNEYMHSRLFDKNKVASFQKLQGIKSKVLLATTPNIGTPGYPLARPAGVKKLVHVFHAFADISAYHIGSLDNYDVVFSVGPHQEIPIREVERARGLRPKKIIPLGLPYFDAQLHALQEQEDSSSYSGEMMSQTLLIAPSWGAKGLLKEYGVGFIGLLAEAGFVIIIRPHPQSFIAEPKFIEKCKAETSQYPNVSWDDSVVGTAAMQTSKLLISDTSSIRFDYAFLFGKPVITLDIPRDKQREYEGQYMSKIWADMAAERLGRVIGHSDVANIVSIVREALSSRLLYDIQNFRDLTITNYGRSATAIVDALMMEFR